MTKITRKNLVTLSLILSILISTGAGITIAIAESPQPNINPQAPAVEISSASTLRAETILKGKPIVLHNGKFELE
jgi:hypothetical protein